MLRRIPWPVGVLAGVVVIAMVARAVLQPRAMPMPARAHGPVKPVASSDEAGRKVEAKRAAEWEKNEKVAAVEAKAQVSATRDFTYKHENRTATQSSEWEQKSKLQKITRAGGHTWSAGERQGFFACHLTLPLGYEHSEVRMMIGDDDAWARPDYDDREWRDITAQGVPQHAGIFWIRYRVRSTEQATAEKNFAGKSYRVPARLPGGVFHKVNAAFDMFWDGWLLARSGVPADRRSEESPGKVDTVFSVPDEWRSPGEHVVAMRMSTHFSDFPGEWTDFNAGFGEPLELVAMFSREAFQPTLSSGAMFMVAAAGFVLWLLADRRPALLLFVGLCLCAALIQWLTVWRYVYTYTYDWHYPVRLAAVYLSAGFGACLLMFVVVFFAVPHRWWLLGAYGLIAVTVLWLPRNFYTQPMNHKAGLEAAVAFGLTLACAAWAHWRRQRGAWIVATGVLVGAIVVQQRPWNFVEGAFLPASLPVMLGLLTAVALRVRDERRRAEQAQLTAARLEVELLKKNLQPHFLMNTLTALTEVIEQNPGAATALIDDLATEFRTLSRMSGEKQVPLAQEIELCRVHLRVMSVRTGVAWSLATEGVDEEQPVPPAMFLTLIENAFVHQRPAGSAAAFLLRMAAGGDGVRYTFFSPGEIQPPKTVRVSGGTGLRYVRARLEESFPGRWKFEHGAVEGGWESIIVVRPATESGGVGGR